MAECQTRCLALEPLQAQSVTEGHQQIHALLGDPGPLVARRPPAVRGRLAATNPRELAVGAVRELDVIDVGGPALSRSRRVHGSGPRPLVRPCDRNRLSWRGRVSAGAGRGYGNEVRSVVSTAVGHTGVSRSFCPVRRAMTSSYTASRPADHGQMVALEGQQTTSSP